jgi:hypothetical protein
VDAPDTIAFADGLEEAGLTETARRVRLLSHDIQTLIQQLTAERSARIALQKRCEIQQEILGKSLYRSVR